MPVISNKCGFARFLLFVVALAACATTIKKRKDPVIGISSDSLRAFGRTIALFMKNALKDRNEYDRISVYFVHTDTSSVAVKRDWKWFVFRSAGLH